MIDLMRLKKEGIMSWSLACYLLLQKGAKKSHSESIVQVLHLFNIICPIITSPKMSEAVVKVGQSFCVCVSCLLEQKYDNKLKWYAGNS